MTWISLRAAPFFGCLVLSVLTSSVGAAARGAVPSDWWARARRKIGESEYEVTWQGRTGLPDASAAWQAPNRANDFRSYFTRDGLTVVPRASPARGESWSWGLSLAGIGRGPDDAPVGEATLSARGNSVEYRRNGILETFVNSPAGLEQTFRIDGPPDPGGSGLSRKTPAHLTLDLRGDLSPHVAPDGQAVDFTSPSGARVVRYARLVATDATGKRLDARMEGFAGAKGHGIRIVFDDAGAAYPIIVDPLATSPAWSAESDQAGAELGCSVATAGDVNGDGYSDVVVGAYLYDGGQTDQGRAYVFLGSASGLGTSPAWTFDGEQAGAELGAAVATAGDVNGDGYSDVIVGDPRYYGAQPNAGRAYVFLGSASGLASSPAWTADAPQAPEHFGCSVATAGDVNGDGYSDVIVGASLDDTNGRGAGAAYVFLGSSSGLALAPTWTALGDQADAQFGESVATAGDVNGDGYADVVVGAPLYDDPEVDEGRAYVYLGSASGLGSSPVWTAEPDVAGAQFGFSVATAGDVDGDGYADVVVGAPKYNGAVGDEGHAYVYTGSPSGPATTPAWTVDGFQAKAALGQSVSTAGDVNGDGYADVIVGTYLYGAAASKHGRADVFLGSASGLAVSPAWTVEGDNDGAELGLSVATAGDVNGDGYSDVIVGAPLYDDPEVDEGRAFVYLGGPGVLQGGPTAAPADAGWMAEGIGAGEELGLAVASAGDVNGDGYADVVVGAPNYDNGLQNEGRALVFLGSAAGLPPTPSWTVDGDALNENVGVSVSSAGDVNGDGYSDVVVGAPGYDAGDGSDGAVLVFLGSALGLAATPSSTIVGNIHNEEIGVSLSSAGDVNGDGYADVIVGTYFNEAIVYLGSAWGLVPVRAWTATGDGISDFGYSVASAGDVNGDGYSDVIVGAHLYEDTLVDQGAAFVYLGSPNGPSSTPSWTAEGDRSGAEFGGSVSTAGDVNGDGYADVIVGAKWYTDGEANEGAAFVYLGSASGLAATPAWKVEANQQNILLGGSVASADDVNGDGYADVIVGGLGSSSGQRTEGSAYIYLGSSAGLAGGTTAGLGDAAWSVVSNETDTGALGYSVASAGDVNGDGYADVVIGAPGYTDAQPGQGRALLYYGNGGSGVGLRPRQLKGYSAAPIDHLGASDRVDAFRLDARGRTPFGRGQVKLAWEVKPLGVPFDGTGTQTSSSWVDTGTGGSDLTEVVTGLASSTPYHWRLRPLYETASTPFQAAGPWLTVPWGGWEESRLRTPGTADLAVTQSDAPDPIAIGENVVYTATVTNAGPDQDIVAFADALDSHLTFVSVTSSQGYCSESSGEVTCILGPVPAGGSATVTVTAAGSSVGVAESAVTVTSTGVDPTPSDRSSVESTVVADTAVGDFAWQDLNGDGVQDPGEPGLANVVVAAYDGVTGAFVGSTATDASGHYRLDGLTVRDNSELRFFPPAGMVATLEDQGGDDELDSDIDPVTLATPTFDLGDLADVTRWDAGFIPSCIPPDEAIFISSETLGPMGETTLTFEDFDQPSQVTGYNVYRSDTPATPPSTWPLVASDIVDGDEATPNIQWTDTSGDVSPTGVWYYEVTAYNDRCPAEGPF